jgi:hypothetical protein
MDGKEYIQGAFSTYLYKLATGINTSSGTTVGLIKSAKVTDSKAL